MDTEMHWKSVAERLEGVRQEAATHRLLRNREAGVNLWARLLPPLKRLERWLERHAGSERPSRAVSR